MIWWQSRRCDSPRAIPAQCHGGIPPRSFPCLSLTVFFLLLFSPTLPRPLLAPHTFLVCFDCQRTFPHRTRPPLSPVCRPPLRRYPIPPTCSPRSHSHHTHNELTIEPSHLWQYRSSTQLPNGNKNALVLAKQTPLKQKVLHFHSTRRVPWQLMPTNLLK